MERNKAVSILKELFDTFSFLEGKSFALMPPNADDVLSDGYQIHIKAALDKFAISRIKEFAAIHGLAMHEELGNLLIIYKSRKSKRIE